MTRDIDPASWLGRALDMSILGGLRGSEKSKFFRQVLLDCAEATHLPELCTVLGSDIIIKFFDHFAGTTLEIPNRDKITQALRDTTIFYRLYRAKHGQRAHLARELAAEYELKEHTVFQIYLRLKKKYEELQTLDKEAEEWLSTAKTML